MSAYMITYDLNATGQKYDEVIQAIKDSNHIFLLMQFLIR